MRILLVLIALSFSAALSATPPEILIEHDGAEVPHGSTLDDGTSASFETVTLDFIIRNVGSGDLTLTGLVSVSDTDNASAVVTEQPSMTVIPPGEETSFQITITNHGTGDFSCDVTVESNDSDEPTTVFTIAGTAVPGGSNGNGNGENHGHDCDDDVGACSTGASTGGMLLIGGLAAIGAVAVRRRKKSA